MSSLYSISWETDSAFLVSVLKYLTGSVSLQFCALSNQSHSPFHIWISVFFSCLLERYWGNYHLKRSREWLSFLVLRVHLAYSYMDFYWLQFQRWPWWLQRRQNETRFSLGSPWHAWMAHAECWSVGAIRVTTVAASIGGTTSSSREWFTARCWGLHWCWTANWRWS